MESAGIDFGLAGLQSRSTRLHRENPNTELLQTRLGLTSARYLARKVVNIFCLRNRIEGFINQSILFNDVSALQGRCLCPLALIAAGCRIDLIRRKMYIVRHRTNRERGHSALMLLLHFSLTHYTQLFLLFPKGFLCPHSFQFNFLKNGDKPENFSYLLRF